MRRASRKSDRVRNVRWTDGTGKEEVNRVRGDAVATSTPGCYLGGSLGSAKLARYGCVPGLHSHP